MNSFDICIENYLSDEKLLRIISSQWESLYVYRRYKENPFNSAVEACFNGHNNEVLVENLFKSAQEPRDLLDVVCGVLDHLQVRYRIKVIDVGTGTGFIYYRIVRQE